VIRFIKRDLKYKEFLALDGVSFTVNKGERLAVMGKNGAGKSTLMKVIAGVLKATEGKTEHVGNIVPLLELGAGFDMQYTGEENIWLYGAMLGYPRDFIAEKFNEIVEFADLGNFIRVPVKNYSSGMRARLGFAIATIVEPDILILDEVLSVGDASFKKKCEKKIMSMFDKETTVLFVSHSETQVKKLCTRGILLDKGRIAFEGTAEEVADKYIEINNA
jgi:ABC-2 type transport system ATP-binding protein